VSLTTGGCRDGRLPLRPGPTTLTVFYPPPFDERVLSLSYDSPPKFLVFLPLTVENAEGDLEGRLARRWEHSSDYRSWTVYLRSDLRWHDGVPVTAHDVKFTLDLMKHPDVRWADPGAYEVHAVDDTTYTIVYRKPSIGNPSDTWTVYYPRHLLGHLDPSQFERWGFWTQPVGNGPYRYSRHVSGVMMELTADSAFPWGRPRVDRVVLKFGGQALAELLSGNVDVVAYATEADLRSVGDDARFRTYYRFPGFSARALVWNHRHRAFRDPTVRRALTLAINRPELLRLLNLPEETPLFDVLHPLGQLRPQALPPPLAHDPTGAMRLLEAAGWRDTDRDGVRENAGARFRFTLSAGPALERAAVYVQAQLRRVGVQADVETLELMTLRERVRDAAFDAALWDLHMKGDRSGGSVHFEEDSPIGYVNPRVGALLRAKALVFDPAEVERIYRELWPTFQADLPVTFLAPAVQTTIAHRRVRGLVSPYRIDPVVAMAHVWLEPLRP
jgi:peptide/nickel transport system substrate-binding protein